MFKYILAATVLSMSFAQTANPTTLALNPTATSAQNLPKCIPRREGPAGEKGPIPPRSVTGTATTQNLVRQTPPTGQTGQQKPASGTPPQFSEAAIKSAETLLVSEWKAYAKPNSTTPPPPPTAWLHYQQANNLTNATKVPAAFFQKW